MEPNIPYCQEEGEIYCVSCGDRACCREHALQGCGFDEPFEWLPPAVDILGVKITGVNINVKDTKTDLGPIPHVKNVLSGSGVQIQKNLI